MLTHGPIRVSPLSAKVHLSFQLFKYLHMEDSVALDEIKISLLKQLLLLLKWDGAVAEEQVR